MLLEDRLEVERMAELRRFRRVFWQITAIALLTAAVVGLVAWTIWVEVGNAMKGGAA